LFETTAIFTKLGLLINQTDRNVDIKSSVGSFSIISQTHAKLSHQRLQHIEFVARIRIGSPFRCAVTDSQLLRLMESLSCSQNRTSAHRKGGPSTSLHHTKDACWQVGTQGNNKNCYRPRIKYNLLISIQSSSPVSFGP